MMAESNDQGSAEKQDLLTAPTSAGVVALPESFQSDSMVTALARLKEKISRLELDRQTAESDMRKLAEETTLFRTQMQGFDRERRRADRPFPSNRPFPSDPPPTAMPPAALSASQVSLGPRHFDGKETEDELFFVPEAKMVAQTVPPEETRAVSNTLDIVENRCFALEQEFRLMRELLEDADRNAVTSRELLLSRQSPAPPPPPPPPPDLRQKRRRDRLDHQLSALLDPPETPRPDSARKRRPKDVAGNLRPHSAPGKPRKPRPRPVEDARGALVGEAERRKARAIVSDLHLEVEGLKEEHRVLAQRLATESNRAQKALLMRDLDRVVRVMEQKGEQMGRIKTYVRRGHVGSRLVVRSKDSLTSDAAKERELGRRPRKVNPTLSMGDVRWTSAP